MNNNNPTPSFVHPRFKLNGFHFSADDLCRVAYSFIKEGDAFEKPIGMFILDWFDNKNNVQMQTSGTTGTPKTIEVSKQAMVNSAIATGDYFNMHEGTKALHCLPTQYVAGKMMLVRAFILGWDMDIIEPTSNPLERNDSQYDFAAMVPLQAQHCIEKLNQIKTLILGGAKVSIEVARQLKSVSTEVYETYGMTETITHIAAKHIDESAFNTLPDVTVDADSRGCLVIHAQNLLKEPVITNDVVDIINQNHFIWLGRYDNVINSGGIKLYPEQIEEKLSPYINQRFFVKGVPDEALGEKLVLVIEGNKYNLNDEIYKDLDKYERPKEVIFADKFAETGSGKIQRSEVLGNTSV